MSDNPSQSDVNLITRFKTTAGEFSNVYQTLKNRESTPEIMSAERDVLLKRGAAIMASISWVTNTVDSISGVLSNILNYNGSQEVSNYINNSGTSLGALPLLPIAAISGSIAIMTKFISDIVIFNRKADEQIRLEAEGVAPERAAEIVAGMGKGANLAGLLSLAKPIILAFGIFYTIKLLKNN